MYSTFNYEIAQARVADMHREGQHDALGRAARQGRQPHKHESGPRVRRLPVFTVRRVLMALGAHN